MEENREKEVMEAAIQAGHLLLENGAEISRVEETMERIFRYYGVESGSTFVLSNGILQQQGAVRNPFCKSGTYPGERHPPEPGGRCKSAFQRN